MVSAGPTLRPRHLTAPSIWLFGTNAFALRLPLALTGVAAIPLAYVLFRMLVGRIEASFAVVLLATSLWHLHFSRVAHWPISYVSVANDEALMPYHDLLLELHADGSWEFSPAEAAVHV